jgi:class 3 adenylate cyclase
MSTSRQLAAIMFADIVGYTAMMQEDEALAMELAQKLKRKLEEEVATSSG